MEIRAFVETGGKAEGKEEPGGKKAEDGSKTEKAATG